MKEIEEYVVNCYADMKMVDFLLKSIPDYKKVLVNRHHKFVQSYFEYNGNLTMIGHAHGYSSLEIRRIFWRIQRKLLLEFVDRIDKGNVMFSRVPSTFKHFLLWQLSQFRDDAEIVSEYILNKMNKQQQQQQHKPVAKVTKAVKVEKEEVKSRFNIDGVTKARRVKVERILDHLSKVENLENIMPKRAYAIAKDLLDGVSFTEVLEKHKKKANYLLTTIIGTASARNRSERGWMQYAEPKNNKVINFPK